MYIEQWTTQLVESNLKSNLSLINNLSNCGKFSKPYYITLNWDYVISYGVTYVDVTEYLSISYLTQPPYQNLRILRNNCISKHNHYGMWMAYSIEDDCRI